MYGLPKDFTGDFFIGRTLEAVTFTVNTVHLRFDNEVSVTVLSSLQHVTSSEDELRDPQLVPLSNSRVMELLGQRVRDAVAVDFGTLRLIFENDQTLSIFDDSTYYESYSIQCGAKETYV
jgi:Family of unknown function (DUF6188)